MCFFINYNLMRLSKSLVVIFSVLSTLMMLLWLLLSELLGLNLLQLNMEILLILFAPVAVAVTFLLIYIVTSAIEIVYQHLNDNISNYIISKRQSQYFRRFLQLDESTTEEIEVGSIKRFNNSVRFLTVNVTNNRVVILIPLPSRIESMEILQSTLPLIREEVSSRMKDYTFQQPERIDFYLKITGRKN